MMLIPTEKTVYTCSTNPIKETNTRHCPECFFSRGLMHNSDRNKDKSVSHTHSGGLFLFYLELKVPQSLKETFDFLTLRY